MKIETIYKNFMGIGGPKDYGLTRRMIQIFLLCMVREGKLRISVGPKSGFCTAWLENEIIVTEERGRSEGFWAEKMLAVMRECYRVLKPGRWPGRGSTMVTSSARSPCRRGTT